MEERMAEYKSAPIGIHYGQSFDALLESFTVNDTEPIRQSGAASKFGNITSGFAGVAEAKYELIGICAAAHTMGLLSGFNGNASLRLGTMCVITKSRSFKARLGAEDFAVLDIESGQLMAGKAPSSETEMHLRIYRAKPEAQAVLHTHPTCLTALGLRLPGQSMSERLNMPVFEAEQLRHDLATVPNLNPGTADLAAAVAKAATEKPAIWLEEHGLCVWAATAETALALSEELEHLADLRLRQHGQG